MRRISWRRASKFGARQTEVDGITFPSRAEARRYEELKILLRAGKISQLEVHPRYPLRVLGQLVCTYEADFRYRDERGLVVVEDVKGVRTPVYKIKRKLMRAVHGIEIREVR